MSSTKYSALGDEINELVDTGPTNDLTALLLAFCSASARVKLKESIASSWLRYVGADKKEFFHCTDQGRSF